MPCVSQDHPHGFVAKPNSLPDGSQDLLSWDCVIPGKANTIWEGGRIKLTMKFSEDYPSKPPECHFGLMPDGSRKPPPGGPFVAAPAGPFKVRDSLASVAVVGRQRRVRERGHIARYGELTRR